MRISDWSSDVAFRSVEDGVAQLQRRRLAAMLRADHRDRAEDAVLDAQRGTRAIKGDAGLARPLRVTVALQRPRSEEHTSELQSLMRISYAVFCLKKKKTRNDIHAT